MKLVKEYSPKHFTERRFCFLFRKGILYVFLTKETEENWERVLYYLSQRKHIKREDKTIAILREGTNSVVTLPSSSAFSVVWINRWTMQNKNAIL